MEALKLYMKIGENGKIDLPESGKLKGRRAELINISYGRRL